MKQLLLATRNKHKAGEFQELLNDLHIEVLTLESFPQIAEVVEDADTLERNALKKAREVFRGAGIPTLADDTGLEVYYLNGEPGVYSSRYAGEKATDRQRCQKLLEEMASIPEGKRQARFVCAMAVALPHGRMEVVEGECRGWITSAPRGKRGFGYDPIFFVPQFGKTMAELEPEEKNRISHRAHALEKLKAILPAFLSL